ncbi:hypothetical protein WJX72_011370 [[Myrmecia] bisecta]|uniref:Cycloeucalenol cycloisomerase n=1 Tax=[Myrmecia] bisecta TaxID=41462 RepID=A0AAW1QGT8_9CHLO
MVVQKGSSRWLAPSRSKRWAEIFFLAYSPLWMIWCLAIVVPFKIYERCDELGYMIIGLGCFLPCVLLPLLIPGKADQDKPYAQRYWVKATVWIAIYSFIGNYFWTHYFYQLLGAAYTFPSWRLNDVPIPLYLMTHAYFCFYHALANVVIRRVKHAAKASGPLQQKLWTALTVFLLAYATAYMETLTIAHFPHYNFKDKARMYSLGSLFYAIYFFVSFPWFLQMDESPVQRWSVGRAATDSLAAGMLVTILLDAWRLGIGAIMDGGGKPQGLPWMS